MIEKNIFQTCSDISKLDQAYLDNIKSIAEMNPGWRYQLFDDAAIRKFFLKKFNDREINLINRIDNGYGVVFADLFRYAVVHEFGGVYLDIKSTLNKPLDLVIGDRFTHVISQWRNRLGEEFSSIGLHGELQRIPGGEFQQWHVVAQAGHPFLAEVIKQVFRNMEIYDPFTFGVGQMGVLRLSGPICYTNTIYPIIRSAPCQILDVQNLGFQYSIFRDTNDRSKHARVAGHYSKNTNPIVKAAS
jgi:mannosyltransferase OCH1-like enzyme